MTTREKRRAALKITRVASRMLDMRSGKFMRKLATKDGDAQMAFALAAEEVGDFDPDQLGEILQMILDFIKALMDIFNS